MDIGYDTSQILVAVRKVLTTSGSLSKKLAKAYYDPTEADGLHKVGWENYLENAPNDIKPNIKEVKDFFDSCEAKYKKELSNYGINGERFIKLEDIISKTHYKKSKKACEYLYEVALYMAYK